MGLELVNRTPKERAEDMAAMLRGLADEMDALAPLMANNPPSSGMVAPKPFDLFPERHETRSAVSYSTWFSYWGGIVGAAHSVEAWPEDPGMWPEWTKGKRLILRPAGLDVALFGCTIPQRPPQALRHGDAVRLRGYVGGTSIMHETRNGTAYMDRPEDLRNGEAPSWIIKFTTGEDMAHGGMSGGPVTIVQPDGSEVLAAVLVTQNSRADLDGDNKPDNSSDVVELVDVWTAVSAVA